MKKSLIIILIVIIGLIIIGFALKPDHGGRRVVRIGKLNIEEFDFLETMELILKNEAESSNLIIDGFSMTISNQKEIISMNISMINQGIFAGKRITCHLISRDNKLIIKSTILEKDKDFTIEKLISSTLKMFQPKKNSSANNNIFNEDHFTKEELGLLISNIKQPILDSLKKQKRLHVKMIARNNYHIYGEPYIYIIDNSGKIIKIQEATGNSNFEIIKENGEIKEYRVNNLKGIGIFDYTDHSKYYFLEEN